MHEVTVLAVDKPLMVQTVHRGNEVNHWEVTYEYRDEYTGFGGATTLKAKTEEEANKLYAELLDRLQKGKLNVY